MGKKKRANQKFERDLVSINDRRDLPEYQDHRGRKQSQVTTYDTTRDHPVSTRNGRSINAVVADEVGSVHTDLRTHQNSSFFPSSTGFEVSGGQFSSYRDHHSTGNVFINVNRSTNDESVEVHGSVPDILQTRQRELRHTSRFSEQYDADRNVAHSREILETYSPVVAQYSASPATSQGAAHTLPPPLPVQKSSDIYYRHLLTSGRGSPLWIPEPSNTLPLEYQRAGIGIGDAIILTDFGGTDFLFNIYHPKGDSEQSINLPTMPEGYCPLDRPQSRDVSSHVEFKNDSFLASSLVKIRRDEESPGLIFESSAMDGAILTMPNGANSTDLKNKTIFRKYVRINAERWYKYANEVCGRDARNGDIRLVVGKTSTTTWGMATFANRSEESAFRLKFKPTGNSGNGIGPATYGWEYSGIAEVKSGPDSHEVEKLRGDDADGGDGQLKVYENQCLFVRTINVTLQDDVWDKLMIEWERLDLDEDEGASSGSNSDSGFGSGGSHLSFGASSTGSSGMSSAGNQFDSQAGLGGKSRGNSMSLTHNLNGVVPRPSSQRERRRRSVHLSSFPPPLGLHPSKIVNRFLLRERPHAKMAITEDDDWISVLDKNDKVFPSPDILISRMMTMYEIDDEEDVVFLTIRDNPLAPMISRPLVVSTANSSGNAPEGRELRRLYNQKLPWPWVDQAQSQEHFDHASEARLESQDSLGLVPFIPREASRRILSLVPHGSSATPLELSRFPLRDLQLDLNSLLSRWARDPKAGSIEIKQLAKLLSELGISDIKFATFDGDVEVFAIMIFTSAGGKGKLGKFMTSKNIRIVPISALGRYWNLDDARYPPKVKTIPTPFTLDGLDELSLSSAEEIAYQWDRSANWDDLLNPWSYCPPPLFTPGKTKDKIQITPRALEDGTGRTFVSVRDVLSALKNIPKSISQTTHDEDGEDETGISITFGDASQHSRDSRPLSSSRFSSYPPIMETRDDTANKIVSFNRYLQSLGLYPRIEYSVGTHQNSSIHPKEPLPVGKAKVMVKDIVYGEGRGNKERAAYEAVSQALAKMG